MAKLNARGRRELVRMVKEQTFTPEPNAVAAVTWRRQTMALMSDGVILQKDDVRFVVDKGRLTSFGWKVRGKVKEGVTPEQFRKVLEGRGFHPQAPGVRS